MSVGRIERAIIELNRFGYSNNGITRLAYSNEEQKARKYLASLCEQEGLKVRIDEVGNLIARREGHNPKLPVVACGSHLDSVKQGGRFDGIIGIVAGLEVIRRLNEKNIITEHPIEVIAFACEESSRFGIATIGSKIMTGNINRPTIDTLIDEDGITIKDALRQCGFEPERIDKALRGPREFKAFLELHSEQGKNLYEKNINIGIVTDIAAPTRFKVYIKGRASHSGNTPMSLRKDALLGACEISLNLEKVAKKEEERGSVATVGVMKVRPGAMNIVPGSVEMHIDIRGVCKESKEAIVQSLYKSFYKLESERDLEVQWELISAEEPVLLNDKLVEEISLCCRDLNISHTKMISGGGHDAMNMASICDTGLIFVPSVNGLGHNPAEDTRIGDIIIGINVLEKIISKLSIVLNT